MCSLQLLSLLVFLLHVAYFISLYLIYIHHLQKEFMRKKNGNIVIREESELNIMLKASYPSISQRIYHSF